MTTPNKEGFWWGKWRIKADDTYPVCVKCGAAVYPGEDPDEPPGDEWEVMHVVDNSNDDENPLMVMVPGVGAWQPLENFIWGDGPLSEPVSIK